MAYSKQRPGRHTGKAVIPHTGPKPAASIALARNTAGRVSAHVAAVAPVALAADGRAFHVEDYRRASQLVKSMRSGKNQVQQQWADALAFSMAAVFEADSKQFGVPFSVKYFVEGTR